MPETKSLVLWRFRSLFEFDGMLTVAEVTSSRADQFRLRNEYEPEVFCTDMMSFQRLTAQHPPQQASSFEAVCTNPDLE